MFNFLRLICHCVFVQGPEEPLIDAQMRKINHLIDKVHFPHPFCSLITEKFLVYRIIYTEYIWITNCCMSFQARVESTHEVLEFDSGCGALAIQLVRRTGCRYTGITLSQEQLEYAQNAVKVARLEDNITFQLVDYRNVQGDHKFNRIISW